MAKNEKLEKDLNEIFERLRNTENKETKNKGLINGVVKAIENLNQTLKDHTSEEMSKTNEINTSLRNIEKQQQEQKSATDLLSQKMDNLDKDFKKTELDLKTEINQAKTSAEEAHKRLDTMGIKIAKWSGWIGGVGAVVGVVWLVYSSMKEQNNELEKRLRDFEKNQAMNYGRQQAIIKQQR